MCVLLNLHEGIELDYVGLIVLRGMGIRTQVKNTLRFQILFGNVEEVFN